MCFENAVSQCLCRLLLSCHRSRYSPFVRAWRLCRRMAAQTTRSLTVRQPHRTNQPRKGPSAQRRKLFTVRLNRTFRDVLLLPIGFSVLSVLLLDRVKGSAQKPPSPEKVAPYSLTVSVNEVGITFHASDSHNLPIIDLKPEEMDVFDNGDGPGQIISMERLSDRPIHAGFIVDTSGSVAAHASHSRAEAQEAVQKLLSQAPDEGIVVAFGRSRRVVQSWTNQKTNLVNSIGRIGAGPHDPIDGTSIFDALFSTCSYEFGKATNPTAANVILLFSDGEDTASYITAQKAIDRCRESHTSIYAFSPRPASAAFSLGPPTLRQLTDETGGRLFYVNDPDDDISADIDTVGKDLRDEYLLLYRPRRLNRDGAFHRIVLVGPNRVVNIVGTSGFYAPLR